MRRYRPFTFRFFRYLWQFKLTRGGRHFLGGLCFSGLGTVSVMIPIYQIFCALASLFLVTLGVGLLFRPRVSVSGQLPPRVAVGEPVTGRITLKNVGRWSTYDVMLRIPGLPRWMRHVDGHCGLATLEPGQSASLPISLRANRRGVYRLPELCVHTTFPFNLVRTAGTRVPMGPLVVVPTFHRLAGVSLPPSRHHQPGGMVQVANVNESLEYVGNREYVPGDPARRLDHRAWARLARPIVREYREEYSSRVAVVLDTYVPRRHFARLPFRVAPLEAALCLVASICEALARSDSLIETLVIGPEVHPLHIGRHAAAVDHVLELLAPVNACRSNPFEPLASTVKAEWDGLSAVLCVLLDWDESRERFLRALVESGCRVKVVVVRDGATTLPCTAEELGCEVTYLTPNRIQRGEVERL